MRNKKRSFILLLAGILLLSSCSLFRPRPHKLFKRALKEQPYDVIIVQGVPFNVKDLSLAMKGRVIWAAYLVKNGLA